MDFNFTHFIELIVFGGFFLGICFTIKQHRRETMNPDLKLDRLARSRHDQDYFDEKNTILDDYDIVTDPTGMYGRR